MHLGFVNFSAQVADRALLDLGGKSTNGKHGKGTFHGSQSPNEKSSIKRKKLATLIAIYWVLLRVCLKSQLWVLIRLFGSILFFFKLK